MFIASVKLPKLPMLKGARFPKSRAVGVPKTPRKRQVRWWDNLVIVFPFNSTWEVALDILFRERDPLWTAQVQFGERGEEGSTRPDWIHPIRKIAFYLDTPIHHFRRLEGRDAYLRAGLESQGWEVVIWDVPTLDYAILNFHKWYSAVIDGRGFMGASV